MAKSGNNAAYIPAKGFGGGVSDDVKYWNQDASNKRQEARLDDQIAYTKEQDAKKERNALYDKFVKPLNSWDTGSESMNEVVARGLQMATEQYVPLIQTLENKDASEDEKLKARLKLQSLNSWPEKMKAFTDKIQTRHQTILKGVEDGSIKKNDKVDNYMKAYGSGWSTFQMGMDDQGNPMIAYRDVDGNSENDILGLETFDNISKGVSEFKFDANFDPDADAAAIAGNLGTSEVQTDSNYTQRTISGFDPKALEIRAKGTIEDENGNLTQRGISYMQDLGYADTPENRQKTVDWFKQKISSFDKKKDITERDNSARISAGNLAMRQKEFEGKNKDEEGNTAEITVDTDKDGKPTKTKLDGGGGFSSPSEGFDDISGDNKNYYSLTPSIPIKAGTKDQPVEISKLYVNSKGDMSFLGKKKVGDESIKGEDGVTTKKPIYEPVKGDKMDTQTLNSVSRLITNPDTGQKFNNYGELSEHFKEKAKESDKGAAKTNSYGI